MYEPSNLELLNRRYEFISALEDEWFNKESINTKNKEDIKRIPIDFDMEEQKDLALVQRGSHKNIEDLILNNNNNNNNRNNITEKKESVFDNSLTNNDSMQGKFSTNIYENDFRTNVFDSVFKSHSSDTSKGPITQSADVCSYDFVRYARALGVIGEEKNIMLIMYAFGNHMSFGVVGPSGSGKTFLTDVLISLIPNDDLFKAELSSKMALFYNTENINGRSVIYAPELQKAMSDKRSPIAEIFKNLGEGKNIERIVTNANRNGYTTYGITNGKTLIFTLAFENYFKMDTETARRFMIFRTDGSQGHFEDIHNYKAQRRASIDGLTLDLDITRTKLSEHLYEVRGLKDTIVIDPFAQYLNEFIPRTQKSIGYVDHYYHLIDASAKFHHKNRAKFSINDKQMIIADLEDHYQIFNLYYDEFVKSIDELDKSSQSTSNKTETNIRTEIADMEKKLPDWQVCFKNGLNILADTLNSPNINKDKILQSWYNHQVQEGKLMTSDYLTGKPLEMSMVYKGLPIGINAPNEPNITYKTKYEL